MDGGHVSIHTFKDELMTCSQSGMGTAAACTWAINIHYQARHDGAGGHFSHIPAEPVSAMLDIAKSV